MKRGVRFLLWRALLLLGVAFFWLPGLLERRGKTALLTLSLLPLAVLFWHAKEDRIAWMQRFGVIVQAAGFLTVFIQIQSALRTHGLPVVFERAWDWLVSVFGRTRLGLMEGKASIGLDAAGQLSVTRGIRDGSLAARLDALEAVIEDVRAEVKDLANDVQDRAKKLHVKIDAQGESLRASVKEVRKELRQQAVGGVGLQLIGLVLFIDGSICGTIAADVVSILCKVRSCR